MGTEPSRLKKTLFEGDGEQAASFEPVPDTCPSREDAMIKPPIPPRFPEDRALDDDMGNWWVLHVKPNCEKMVARYLINRSISYYLPLYERQTRVGYFRRIRTTIVPLFGGYICFALPKIEHRLLYDTKKFVRIIEVDDQESFVSELSNVARAIESGEELVVRPGLVPGRKVLILSGPLEGTEGVIVKSRHDRHLAVSVQMFNQSVLVRLDPLTKIEPQ
jgi:transcription antitermination factor NusG